MMKQIKKTRAKRANKKGLIANKVIRITDRDYEGLLQFGEVGKPLSVAFAKVLEAVAKSREASIAQRKARRATREQALLDYTNDNTTETKLTTVENSGIQNVGERSATGHHTNSTSTPSVESHSTVPDLQITLTNAVDLGDESPSEIPTSL